MRTTPIVARLFLIATIASAAWLICAVLLFLLDLALARYRVDGPDNRVARRIRTQVLILRRLAIVVTVVLAAGAILLTFPGAQAAGASVLASAGLVSIVAGLAAQSTLANVFAGMQLAFSDAIRVDDVVIAEEQWGRIEEITLTYVVAAHLGRPADGAALDLLHLEARSRTGPDATPNCSARWSSISTGE